MQYFFTPENKLPSGVGFDAFGQKHIFMLLFLFVLSFFVIRYSLRISVEKRTRLEKILSGLMILMEFLKDFILTQIGAFGIGYLPLHLCSIDMFICLYAAWHPASDLAGELTWCFVFSGGIMALLFPDWTNFPIFHFQSLHSFLYHAMLVQFSLILVLSGQAQPRISKVPKALLILAAVALPVGLFDKIFHTNYMFLLRAVPGSPLELCTKAPGGEVGYLAAYAGLVAAILLLLNFPFSLYAYCKKRCRNACNRQGSSD